MRNFLATLKTVLRGNRYYYAWLGCLLALIALGIAAYLRQLELGLIVTAMRDPVSWGFYISNFTFLVGVAAAAVLLVIPAYIYNFKPIKEIACSSWWRTWATRTACRTCCRCWGR
jgi:molybdopterin-containing oxidoreductase family membrane subunit